MSTAVQYCKRAHFEYHPENDLPYDMLIGLLGNEILAAGLPTFQPPPVPTPITAPVNPEFLTPVGNTVYFAANDGIHGRELWRTDGTAAGMRLMENINTPAAD